MSCAFIDIETFNNLTCKNREPHVKCINQFQHVRDEGYFDPSLYGISSSNHNSFLNFPEHFLNVPNYFYV